MAKKPAETETAPAVTFPPGMLSEALGEIERMQRVWRAFDAAHKAITGLANYEQVNRELAAERDRLTAEVAKLTAERDAGVAAVAAAKDQAAGIVANARAAAEEVQNRAATASAKIEAEAQDMRRKAGEVLQSATLDRQNEERARDHARAERKAEEERLADVRQKMAAIKALAAA